MRTALSLAALLAAAVSCSAAPLAGSNFPEKFLLDDTDFVLTINVKQIHASALFTKHIQKLAEEILKKPETQRFLKDTGFNPLKDVDRVTVVMGRSGFGDKPDSRNVGPLFLIQGRFDPAKLHAKAEALGKEFSGVVSVSTRNDVKVYAIKDPGTTFHMALLDKGMLALAPKAEMIHDVIDKAAGKKKTTLKYKELSALLVQLDAETSVNAVATATMVMSASGSSKTDPTGKVVTERKFHTLGETGVQALQVTANVRDDLKVRVVLTAKDADSAAMMAKNIEEAIKKEAPRAPKELAAVGKALAAAKVSTKGKDIVIEGEGDAEVVQQMVTGLLFRGIGSSSGPKPLPKDADSKQADGKKDDRNE